MNKNKNQETKRNIFFKWCFKKWYFWLTVGIHFFFISISDLAELSRGSVEVYTTDIISSLMVSFVFAFITWSVIFGIAYLFYKKGRDSKN